MYPDRTPRFTSVVIACVIASAGILSGIANAQNLSSNPHDMRDAFAQHGSKINTPQAFSRFVAQNDALRARYARHFSVPQDRIVSFFRDSLVPYQLPTTQTLTTYGVTKSGNIYPVNTTLPKGTQVWATREGVPVLKWNCSNPLAASLPGSNLTPPLELANTPSPVLPEGNTPVLAVPEMFATTGTPALPGDTPLVAAIPVEPDANFGFAVPTADASSASLPGVGEIIDGAGPGLKDFWPILLVPAVVGLSGGGGNNGGSGETPPFQAPAIVPESNTLGLLAMGLPLLGAAGFFARRRK